MIIVLLTFCRALFEPNERCGAGCRGTPVCGLRTMRVDGASFDVVRAALITSRSHGRVIQRVRLSIGRW